MSAVVVHAEIPAGPHALTGEEAEGLTDEEAEAKARDLVFTRLDAPDGYMIVSTYVRLPVNVLPSIEPWPSWLLTDDDGRPTGALFMRQEPDGDLDRSYIACAVCIPVG